MTFALGVVSLHTHHDCADMRCHPHHDGQMARPWPAAEDSSCELRHHKMKLVRSPDLMGSAAWRCLPRWTRVEVSRLHECHNVKLRARTHMKQAMTYQVGHPHVLTFAGQRRSVSPMHFATYSCSVRGRVSDHRPLLAGRTRTTEDEVAALELLAQTDIQRYVTVVDVPVQLLVLVGSVLYHKSGWNRQVRVVPFL